MRILRTSILVAFGVFAIGMPVQAGALLRLTPDGVAVSDQIILDPVLLDGDGFRLTYHSDGSQPDVIDPLFLIIATPEGSTATAPSLAYSDGNPYTLSSQIGITSPSAPSTVFDSTDTGSVYDALGFVGGNASENYTNWNSASGLTSWDVWVYQITFNPDLGTGDWVEFSTGLDAGSFVVGYGCTEGSVSTTSGCVGSRNGKIQSTPFTFAGMVTVPEEPPLTVPEPSSLVLLGIGLATVTGEKLRKRKRKLC